MARDKVLAEFDYDHPVFDLRRSRRKIRCLAPARHTAHLVLRCLDGRSRLS